MRKPIALTVAGLLLTGAIQANADEFSVVESPENLIHVNQIRTAGGLDTSTLRPSINGIDSRYRYDLEVEAVVENLVELTVCLYDNSEVTAENTISDICYNDFLVTENLSTNFFGINMQGATAKSDVAFSSFVPDYIPYVPEDGNWGDGTTWEMPLALLGFDSNKPTAPAAGEGTFSLEHTIGTQTVATDSIYHINFVVTPDQRLQKGIDWKVRVSAVYDGVTDRVELTDSNTYTVPYFSGFDFRSENNRGQVDYGDLYENSAVTKTDIVTGKYYANSESRIYLKTNSAFTKVGSTETIAFKSSTPATDENALSLACTAGNEATVFLSESPQTFVGSVAASNGQPSLLQPLEATKHSCTLSVGSGFELGSYRADLTVSILEKPESQQII